jgi:hypothetical protein
MMIEELLKSKKISQEQFDIYQLFHINELGRKTLDRMTYFYFMEEPKEKEFIGEGFAFYDGRRSVFRDIHRIIFSINDIIKEATNG